MSACLVSVAFARVLPLAGVWWRACVSVSFRFCLVGFVSVSFRFRVGFSSSRTAGERGCERLHTWRSLLGLHIFSLVRPWLLHLRRVSVRYPTRKALGIAQEMELDLVEISPKADPPVCKIIDYKKFLYEQKKRDKALKAKATKVIVKEIRFGPQTDDHDFEFKKRHAEKFLKEGAKLKAFVFFKGRSIVYKDQGEILLLRLAQELEELGKVEQMPKLEGKRMTMFLAPKTVKK